MVPATFRIASGRCLCISTISVSLHNVDLSIFFYLYLNTVTLVGLLFFEDNETIGQLIQGYIHPCLYGVSSGFVELCDISAIQISISGIYVQLETFVTCRLGRYIENA